MKKITAILLMGLLSFNWFGYKLVVRYLQNKADRRLETRIDLDEYDESQLLEIKVSLNMPYQNNQADFERCYGEINIEGKIYTYVKRKIEGGNLILKCIPNTVKQNIENVDNRIFTNSNGLNLDHNSGKKDAPLNSINKNLFNFFDHYSADYNLNLYYSFLKMLLSTNDSVLQNRSFSVVEQPPDYF